MNSINLDDPHQEHLYADAKSAEQAEYEEELHQSGESHVLDEAWGALEKLHNTVRRVPFRTGDRRTPDAGVGDRQTNGDQTDATPEERPDALTQHPRRSREA